MTIRLRGHHLLCLLSYVGAGYSRAFVENADALAARLTAGEGVVLVEGPDDLCAPRLATETEHHCFTEDVAARDLAALRDVGRLLGRELAPGSRMSLSAARIAHMRRAFSQGTIRPACAGCSWRGLCDSISAGGFAEGKLRPPPPCGRARPAEDAKVLGRRARGL